MICPHCRAEYRPGFTVCSDCDIELVEDSGSADVPSESVRGPATLEPFHETHNSDELAALLESLEENGIPYVVQAGTALALLSGATGSSNLPEEWHARILVLGSRLSGARALLELLRQMARGRRDDERSRAPEGVL